MNAVIFDLYETLITEWGKPKYTARKIATDLDIDYQQFQREWSSLRQERDTGKLSGTKNVCQRILNNLGVSRDEKLLSEISAKREEYKNLCFKDVDPQIITLLSSLKSKGLKIGLISNCSSEEIRDIKDCVLYPYFDAVVLSCDIGLIKPDICIYNHCLALLSEKASDCFYVGDGGSDELWGAMQVGLTPLRALWFTKEFLKDFDADKTYLSFLEPSSLLSYVICD